MSYYDHSRILGPAILSEPRYKCSNKLTIVESRLLKSMMPGCYYSNREVSKRTSTDLSTIDEGMKKLYKKGLISVFWYYDTGRFRTDTYKIYTLKTVSDNNQKMKTPSSSSSSSSDSDSDSDNIYPYSKVHIRKLSEKKSEAVEVV